MPGTRTLYLTSFVGGFVIVSLETLGFRLLAPYFGTSVFVSGTLVGIVMLALSLGYWLGGRLADRSARSGVLFGLVAASMVWVLGVSLLHRSILELIAPAGFATDPGAVGPLLGVSVRKSGDSWILESR